MPYRLMWPTCFDKEGMTMKRIAEELNTTKRCGGFRLAHPVAEVKPVVTACTPITNLLAAPLSLAWTIEDLAEQVLGLIAAQQSEVAQEFVVEADAVTDRQSRRLLRPIFACLAVKSAAEAGTPARLYGGRLSFQRPGPEGPVWILGHFENTPAAVRIALRRFSSPPISG
jgi:hypothetical protein